MELIFPTDNSNKFSTKLTPGQCMGMSCDWAKVSLSLKNVYRDALIPGKWDIGQSAYEFGISRTDLKIIDAFGMNVINSGGQGVRQNIATSEDVANNLVALPKGSYVWGVEGVGGAHALGYRRTATNYDLFDPNFGMQTTTMLIDFRQTLMNLITNNYPKLLQYMDIYQVALP